MKIPANGKIRVYWNDKPENYSRQNKAQIISHFSKKYNVPRKSINVIFKPVKLNKDGKLISISGGNLENIMNPDYQRQLFKEWLEREKKDVNFDDILKLDDKVNLDVKKDVTELRQQKYHLKWIKINNFLSFGDIEPIYLDRFKGITCITSTPANQSGKTSFSIDAPMFLFFGETTKTDKNEEIFNQYSNSDTLIVRGMLDTGDSEFIIERKMDRKLKKDGTWQITNKVNYYQILPDGEEQLMNEEDCIRTTTIIRDIVGTKEDFMLMVLATANNIEESIDSTATEKGRLINRFIGLDVIEEKEEIVRKLYNTFSKTLKSNLYNIVDLEEEIITLTEDSVKLSAILVSNQTKLDEIKGKILELEQKKKETQSKKLPIDNEIVKLSPTRISEDIQRITNEGLKKNKDIENIKIEISNIGNVNFDEDKHHSLTKEKRESEKNIDKLTNEITVLNETIDSLKKGEICPTCKRKLDDVDNSEHIKENETLISKKTKDLEILNKNLSALSLSISNMENERLKSLNKSKLELQRDRLDVDLSSLRNDLKKLRNDEKSYNLNLSSIELNKKLESEILGYDSKVNLLNIEKEEIIGKNEKIKSEIAQNTKDINTKTVLIDDIKKEQVEERVYKTYIDMVGRKGISKIVLRSVLPIINLELHRLLDDVTDFDVEVQITDKNDIEFFLLKDGVYKKLKSGSGLEKTASALALRFVLSQISSLPKPNFIAFDEVLGKVADENFDTIKLLFEKATEMFDAIFIITHKDIVKDWSENIILIEKVDNISKIYIK